MIIKVEKVKILLYIYLKIGYNVSFKVRKNVKYYGCFVNY